VCSRLTSKRVEVAEPGTAEQQSIVDWAGHSALVDGVVVGGPDEGEDGPVICAVALVSGLRGYGKGLTRYAAVVSAIGEALEQYAARCVPRRTLIRAPYRDVSDQAFDPRWLCLYSPAQYRRRDFPFQPFDPARPLWWTPGRWVDTGEPVLLPAAAVYLAASLEREEALCQATSNGLAAGAGLDDAIARATLEVYERGEFLRSWLARQPGVAVDALALAPDFRRLIEGWAARGACARLYLLASNPYVAICVTRGDGVRWPGVTLGLGAGWRPLDALHKAVLEHGQTGPYFARLWCGRERPLPSAPEDIQTFEDHALFYCDPRHAGEFDFLADARCTSPTPAAESRIAIADLTPPGLHDSPFRIVRAVAHGLQPLHCGAGFERAQAPAIVERLGGRPANHAPIPVA